MCECSLQKKVSLCLYYYLVWHPHYFTCHIFRATNPQVTFKKSALNRIPAANRCQWCRMSANLISEPEIVSCNHIALDVISVY